jgi:hypothetical protein
MEANKTMKGQTISNHRRRKGNSNKNSMVLAQKQT